MTGVQTCALPIFIEWLVEQKRRSLVGNIGIATSPTLALNVLRSTSAMDAAQVPSNILSPAISALDNVAPATLRTTHSAIAFPLARINERVASDSVWAAQFAKCAEIDLRDRGALAKLMLAWALSENANGIVILGASNPKHYWDAASVSQSVDKHRLQSVSEFLAATLPA